MDSYKENEFFEIWDLMENKLQLPVSSIMDINIDKKFCAHTLHSLINNYPKNLPSDVGNIFDLEHNIMAMLSPEPPYISYNMGTQFIRFVQSHLPKEQISFSLLNINRNKNLNLTHFCRFLEKFNINTQLKNTSGAHKIKKMFNFSKKTLRFEPKDFEYDVVFLWDNISEEEYHYIKKYFSIYSKPFMYIAKDRECLFYRAKFQHPELAEYSICII